ncbi:MAG: benzoate-CoA ligase family protein [Alphaproteobacteria bacterium]|nr:benzoate-CoA ligase family protein [Alphaproteobacteria bacterium]
MTDGARRFGDLYNAASDLIGRNLKAGRGGKTAYIVGDQRYSYDDVEALSNRFANLLGALGVGREARVLLCMLDTIDLVAAFLGAIKAGVVPVPVNTRLTQDDYGYMLDDSRAEALVVSDPLADLFPEPLTRHPTLKAALISESTEDRPEFQALTPLMAAAESVFEPAPTRRGDICFWLYTSGTTGQPKGVVHAHEHLIATADTYGAQVLGLRDDDVVFSAAKLFFAYGLGNALTFPMAAGATTILLPGPPTPDAVNAILRDGRPTVFYGVPTLFGMLLASQDLPSPGAHALRLCTSAGEPLPADLLRRWRDTTGTDIIDGIGTTEMLHIFLSNSPDDITPGSTGRPVPGYGVRLVGEDGQEVANGEIGTLEVSGPSAALMYWNQRAKSLETFRGPWTRTGDKYTRTKDGVYVYSGRTDDMMKVGGIYVSPFEVEAALVKHDAVLESGVVGQADEDDLIKPKAYVVLNEGHAPSDAMAEALIDFVAQELAAFKRPRWIAFIDALPKTATGKIQRFKLRANA